MLFRLNVSVLINTPNAVRCAPNAPHQTVAVVTSIPFANIEENTLDCLPWCLTLTSLTAFPPL